MPQAVGSSGERMTKKRILFIDNRPDHLGQPVLRLQFAGYDVDTADSGRAGLEKLRSDDYDLLILDAELPNEDGWDVLQEARRDPDLAHVKVIVFMAPQGETGKLVLVPVDAELRRPFSLGALLETVERVLGST
jgi:two-component system, OmpR family, phosphate regulon response regulator PhoB